MDDLLAGVVSTLSPPSPPLLAEVEVRKVVFIVWGVKAALSPSVTPKDDDDDDVAAPPAPPPLRVAERGLSPISCPGDAPIAPSPCP